MASTITAKIAPLPRGNYSSSATYDKLDVVSYNGSSYMAIKSVPTGTAPTNTTYWQMLAAQATIADNSITDAKLVQSGGVLSEVSSLKSDIYSSGLYKDGDFSFTQGGIRSNDGGEYSSNTLVRSNSISINKCLFARATGDYEFYVMKGLATSPYTFMGVLQSNGTFATQTHGTSIYKTQYFNINNDANHTGYYYRIVVNKKSDPTANITPADVADYVKYYNAEIPVIESDISDIKNVLAYEKTLGLGAISPNKYISATGTLANSSGWSATESYLPVSMFSKLLYSNSYTRSYEWNAWYKEPNTNTGSFISQFTISQGTGTITVPSAAKYMRLSAKTADLPTLTLTGVGDSHSALFNPIRLKVCSYNVGLFTYGESGGTVVDSTIIAKTKAFFTKYQFDILQTQEYRDSLNNVTMDGAVFNYLYPYSSGGGNWTKIKSQFPIFNTSSASFSTGRSYRYGTVTINGHDVFLADVHLSIDNTDRATEYTELIALLGTHEWFICCGDFNPMVDAQADFDQFINAGFKVANGGYLGLMDTYHNYTAIKSIDNIVVSPNIVMANSYVLDVYDEMLSDHLPIVADIVIY